MISVSAAIDQLIATAKTTDAKEQLPVTHSLGRVLATDITATINVPPADNSAMDGYAFCYADALKSDFKLPLSQRIPAGVAPKALNHRLLHVFLPALKYPLVPIPSPCRKTALSRMERDYRRTCN